MRQTQHRGTLVGGLFPLLLKLALGLCLVAAFCAQTVRVRAADDAAARRSSAQAQFARAEAMRAALEAKPERQRSLQEYKDVITAYRRVYLITPHAVEVPDALMLIGDFYRHMGEQFEPSYFESAVESYEFLLHEYPTTKHRDEALLAIADIQRKNLGEPNLAEENYKEFLERYPNSSLAARANSALADMHSAERFVRENEGQAHLPLPEPSNVALASGRPAKASEPITETKDVPPAASGTSGDHVSALSHIRVWNADTYTRIIIDLGGEAKYRSARISNPDRIYFDIENARLAEELVHQPVEVPAGGYLKTVRVAQNREDVVRVVLEVTQVKDYSVFELTDPDRLVVDVYGPNAQVTKSITSPAAGAKAALPPPVNEAATPIASPFAPKGAPAVSPSGASASTRDTKSKAGPTGTASSAEARGGPAVRPPAIVAPSSVTEAAPKESAKASEASVAPRSAEVSNTLAANNAPPLRAAEVPTTVAPKPQPSSSSAAAARASTDAPRENAKKAAADLKPPAVPELTLDGEHSLTRALGLKVNRIVIDAGHGGHDTGTIGPTGLMEKDVCLDVALRLGKLIQQRLPSAEVTYTRDDDTYVSLEQRTELANEAKADLFISIHANSSADRRVSGIETYYLNFNASPQAMQVAARENALAQASVHDLDDLVNKIARNEKIEESRDLAEYVQESLAKRAASSEPAERNRGVRRAPFIVLIGAKMPSVLAEISFLSNPADEQWLKKGENRQRIAEGLFRGIENYLQSTNSLASDAVPQTERTASVER